MSKCRDICPGKSDVKKHEDVPPLTLNNAEGSESQEKLVTSFMDILKEKELQCTPINMN